MENNPQVLRLALAKGRVAQVAIELLEEIGYHFPDYSRDSRKLVFEDTSGKVAFFLVKSPDVPTYVEKGTADVGIVGKDVLMEHPAKVYEMLNLDIGKCRMCVCGYPGTHYDYSHKLRVGSKYVGIAKAYFDSIDQPVDLIEIQGSVELAPVLGLSDVIVDIVETGSTLKENGLTVLETICPISSRLIVNQVSLKTKNDMIVPLLEAFEKHEDA